MVNSSNEAKFKVPAVYVQVSIGTGCKHGAAPIN